MLTPFGRFLRKLRIDRGEIMKDMAAKLQVTASFLSAVEVGKKAVPDSWVPTLGQAYGLGNLGELQHLADLSKPDFKVEVPRDSDDLRRETALMFSRKVGAMDHDTLTKILNVMLSKGECE
jgi:HTH-type transcriptional regulator, competence development regulator